MALLAALIVGIQAVGQLDPLTRVATLSEGLQVPARLAVTDTEILVADPQARAIVRFDLAGTYLGSLPESGAPVGVAVYADGRIVVSRRDDAKVAVYDASFTFQHFLADGVVNFVRPTDMTVDPTTDRLYVVDSMADRLYAFSSDESLALILGIRGGRSSEFKYASAVAVDPATDQMVVTDQDNFRAQVFARSGLFIRRFGHRIKFLPGGISEGWMPRSSGLAFDAAGSVYVTDALMGTLRIFTTDGAELGKVLDYGTAPGELRTPGDVEIDAAGRVYVANSGAGTVEIYAPVTLAAAGGVAGVFYDGTNAGEYDLALRRRTAIRGGSGETLGTGSGSGKGDTAAPLDGWDPPHMLQDVTCSRCHDVDAQPGGHLGLAAGQVNLCQSCHTGAGQASARIFQTQDMADPYGTNPDAPDGRGRSHAWGVPAVNADADSVGPAAGGVMDEYLDGGLIKCATCHDQHNNDVGAPLMRVPNEGDAMCKECHAPRDEGLGQRGTHPVGFAYPSGTGEFPLSADVGPAVIKEGNVECMTCHAPHYADSGTANDGRGDGMLLRAANDGTLCQVCHTEHATHAPGGPWQPTCVDCHDPHDPDSENLSLVGRTVVNQTLGVDKAVVFTARDGANSFDDGDPANNDGICQVCHTSTTYHRHDGTGTPHNAGVDCTGCHPHDTGFMPSAAACTACHGQPPDGDVAPNRAGTHDLHMNDPSGPGIANCWVCHASMDTDQHMNQVVSFASGVDANGDGGIDLSETDVCDACHSPGGPFNGVTEAKGNWVTAATVSCEGCHDTGTSAVFGVSAPPVAGDGVTWGYYASGHGRGGQVACTDCHDPAAPHFDGQARTYSFDSAYYGPSQSGVAYAAGYRLKLVGGEVPMMIPASFNITFGYNAADMRDRAFRLCFECHSSPEIFDDTPGDGIDSNYRASLPNPPRNYSYAWGSGADINEHVAHIMNYIGVNADSDWDAASTGPGGSDGRDSLTNCTTCHNVHGASGTHGSTNEPMMRDGALVGRPGYGFSYVVEDAAAGGYPWVTSTGATRESSVGAILRLNTSTMCGGSMCHGSPTPPPASSYDATGSGSGTYLEYYRPPMR